MKKQLGQSGIIHTFPLLVIIAAVGIISFLFISSTAPFQGGFGNLFSKPLSHAATTVPLYDLFEQSAINSKTYSNPFDYTIISLNTSFTSPSGKVTNFYGFFDGDGNGGQNGSVWKFRFMPNETGTWTYTYTWSDGTAGGSGTFDVVSTGAKPGPLRVDTANPHYWKFADGSRFSAKGINMDLQGVSEDPIWKYGVNYAFGGTYHFNLVRTGFYYDCLQHNYGWDKAWPNPNGNGSVIPYTYSGFFPFMLQGGVVPSTSACPNHQASNVDFSRPSVKWLDHFDINLKELASHNTVWYNQEGLTGAQWGTDSIVVPVAQQRLWTRYYLARFAPYWNVMWNLAGEWEEHVSSADLDALGSFVKQNDPWNHPLSTHSLTVSPNRSWSDFTTIQCLYNCGSDNALTDANRIISNYSNKPVYGFEMAWEDDPSGFNANLIRSAAWGIIMGQGFYQYFDQTTPNWSGGGYKYVEIMDNFIYNRPYYTFNSCNNLVNSGTLCLSDLSTEFVIYRQFGGTNAITVNLSGLSGSFNSYWFNTKSGSESPIGTVTAGGSSTFSTPDGSDWVLHLTRTALPSTSPQASSVPTPQPSSNPTLPPVTVGGITFSRLSVQSANSAVYSWDTLALNKLVYGDRTFTYSQIPAAYLSLPYLRTSNVDKSSATAFFLSFTVDKPVTVYIAYDHRITPVIGWMYIPDNAAASYIRTTDSIITSDTTFDIYSKDYPAGTIQLGGNGGNSLSSMYGVIVKASGGSSPAPTSSPVSVTNITTLSGRSYVTIPNGMQVGSTPYIDRAYTIDTLPSGYQGMTQIRTANDDKLRTENNFLTFNLNQPATVYVALDTRVSPNPSWLTGWINNSVQLTSSQLGTNVLYNIYSRAYPAGNVALGANIGNSLSSMYMVFIR